MLIELAWKSLMNRRASVILTLASISVSVAIVIAIEHIRDQAEKSFNRTVSGVDLIVGARTSPINLLLSSVFRIGSSSTGISWESYELIASDDRVAWVIPISLGDSHAGFRVMGTTEDYFKYFKYGSQRAIRLQAGEYIDQALDAVIGSEVAGELGYLPGDEITLAHGLGDISFLNHTDSPFTVTGVLQATGTPVDQTVHVSLAGLESIHGGLSDSNREQSDHESHTHSPDEAHPDSVTALLIGLNSRRSVFAVQQGINEYPNEAIMGILPGVTLAELWEMMGSIEKLLQLISVLVLFASLLGLSTMLLASMRERQKEIMLFRSIGMHTSSVVFLIEIEALLITSLGISTAYLLVVLGITSSEQWLNREYGLFVDLLPFSQTIAIYFLTILLSALLLALVPAISAYRRSLPSSLRS